MDSLAKGVDPLSTMPFPENSMLINDELKDIFSETSKLLEEFIDEYELDNSSAINSRNLKDPFNIQEEDFSKIHFSDELITISKFTNIINKSVNRPNMRKLKATQITLWLVSNNYLSIQGNDDNGYYKISTAKGESIGITTANKINSIGKKYATNFYDKVAQKFIIDNINDISVI